TDVNDTAPAAKDGKFGYIDIDGEFIVSPSYSFAGIFSDSGLAKVIDSNGKSAYVDSRGRVAFGERFFDYVSDFTDSYAFAYTLTARTGGTTDTSDYALICSLLGANGTVTDLPEEQSIECIIGDKYIGTTTNKVIESDRNADFTKRYAVFSCNSLEALTDYYDRIIVSGMLLIMCNGTNEDGLYKATLMSADTLQTLPGEYLCPVDVASYDKGAVLLKKDNGTIKQVLITDSAKEVYTAGKGSAIISGFDKSGYACIYENGRYIGLSEDESRFESDFQFGSFNCGLAPYYDNNKIGYINTAGGKIIEAQYDGASEFYADGYAYVKSGTEYSIIDMNGNIIAGGLAQSQSKLLFSNSVHDWYDLSDFEQYSGEPMYIGDICFGESTAEYDAAENDYVTNMLMLDKEGKIISKRYSLPKGNSVIDNGCFLVSERSAKESYLAMSDGSVIQDSPFYNAAAVNTASADVIRHEQDNMTLFSDLYGNTIKIAGECRDNVAYDFTAVELTEEKSKTKQTVIYDNILKPALSVYSTEYCSISQYGSFLYMHRYRSAESDDAKNRYIVCDPASGKVLLSLQTQPDALGEYFWEYKWEIWDTTVYTAYGKELGNFVYAKAYGDKLLCFDYDKYRLFDRYGQLIGEYDYRPKINADSGSIVLKNDDGTFSLYDRYFGLILTTKYDIQPCANGYIPFADMQKGKLGLLDINGNICVEPAYDYISSVTPDGYFASKVRETTESDDIVYYDNFVTVYINSITGGSVKCAWGIENADAVKDNGYSLLDFYTAVEYYQASPDRMVDVYVSATSDGSTYYYDTYGNVHYDEYPSSHYNNSIDEYTVSELYDGSYAVHVFICSNKNRPESYYLKLDGTPIKKGDTGLELIDGYPVEYNNNNGITILNSDGTKLLSIDNIGISLEYYDISISITGHYIIITKWGNNEELIFVINTGEKVYTIESCDSLTPVFEGVVLYRDSSMYHLLDLETGKEYTSDEHPHIYGNDYTSTSEAEYPIICTYYDSWSGTNEARVYSIDSDMNAEYICSYYCDDDETMWLEDKERILVKSKRSFELNTNTVTLINLKSGKQSVFENVILTNSDDKEGLILTVQDESDENTYRIYRISTDLETITEE
ncbi:MAG: WG repeat-containing protein, partial [Ruminiclostridium sp.]